MDFSNPDNRCKVFLGIMAVVLFVFITAIWAQDGRLASTGGVLCIPMIGVGVWMGFGYEGETYEEAAERKRAKKNKTGLDSAV